VIVAVAARMDALSHEIFIHRCAQKRKIADEKLEVKDSGMQTMDVQTGSLSTSFNGSLPKKRSSSRQVSLAYSDSEVSFTTSFTSALPPGEQSHLKRESTFYGAPEPDILIADANQHEHAVLEAELHATQHELAELQAELRVSQIGLAELKAELCAIRYGSQLSIFAAKAIFKKHTEDMQRRHWLNTRALVQSMTHASSGSRAGSTSRRSRSRGGSTSRRSRSLPPSEQLRNVNAASTDSQPDPRCLSSASGMQPVGESQHIQNECPQVSLEELNMRTSILLASGHGNSAACSSSSSSGSPQGVTRRPPR